MKRRGAGSDVGPFKGSDPDITAITWAIVNKIKRHGQRATMFIFNMLPDLRNALAVEIDIAMRRAVADNAKGGSP